MTGVQTCALPIYAGNAFGSDFATHLLLPDSSVTVHVNCTPATGGNLIGQVRWVAAQDTAYSAVTAIGKMCSGAQDTARVTIAIQDIIALNAKGAFVILPVSARKQTSATQVKGKCAPGPIPQVFTKGKSGAPAVQGRAYVGALVGKSAVDAECPPAAFAGRKIGCILRAELEKTEGK